MAVTTKKTFPATTNATTTVFSPVGIQLNNQDDLDVYVTLSGGTRVLQLRQSTGSTAQSSHPQVNNTDGLYFPAVSAGTTLYNYQLSTDNNTITFNSALPQGAVVFCERRTRDADSSYTTFASGSTIRATDLNNSATESNFTAQDARNKALDLEGSIFSGVQPTIDGVAQPFVTSAKIIDGTIVNDDISGSAAIAQSKIATGNLPSGITVNSSNIVDGSVTTVKLAADSLTNAKIADDSIDSEHYVDGSIDTVHIADGNITHAKIQDNAVITTKIADGNVTAAKIGTNAVTTDKIADAELSTLASMPSGTASILADSTALTATTTELNQLDGITLETSVTTNSDTRIPTSKAVNDLVLSVTNALGGFVAISNETSFPTTNPDPSNNAGTVVSISQLANSLSVNSSGVATITNGAGTGNTVTITGFPTSLVSQTLPANSGLQVQTTSTLHTYTFHKQLASAADIQAISATVNSFSNRYRVSASAPTSSLDGGDLWYDTTNSRLMVYSSQTSAWEETTAIGNFFISTLSSSSATGGGSATPNGTAYRFTISDAPNSAQQCIVSVDGVIQKPNAGTSQPSEGFAISGNDIIFGSAPANGATIFVTVLGASVGIGTPSNNTVSTAVIQNAAVTTGKIADDSVTTAKIADANVTTAKIVDANVTTAKIADQAVTLAKLPHGTSSNDGKFLRANNGADPTFETVDFTTLNASNLTSGTIPDARFPATLPAISGANLTNIEAFPSGTKMLFQQTAAPTGWTKVTSGVDNKALRVVSGTAGSGGSNAFSNTLADRSITANAGNTTATGNISVANAASTGNVTIDSATTGGTVDSHTLTIAQIPSHTHSYVKTPDDNRGFNNTMHNNYVLGNNNTTYNTGSTGGGQGHSHGFTGGSHTHTASFTGANHNHNATFTGAAHNHSISVTNLDMAVQYLDVIIAAKD